MGVPEAPPSRAVTGWGSLKCPRIPSPIMGGDPQSATPTSAPTRGSPDPIILGGGGSLHPLGTHLKERFEGLGRGNLQQVPDEGQRGRTWGEAAPPGPPPPADGEEQQEGEEQQQQQRRLHGGRRLRPLCPPRGFVGGGGGGGLKGERRGLIPPPPGLHNAEPRPPPRCVCAVGTAAVSAPQIDGRQRGYGANGPTAPQ